MPTDTQVKNSKYIESVSEQADDGSVQAACCPPPPLQMLLSGLELLLSEEENIPKDFWNHAHQILRIDFIRLWALGDFSFSGNFYMSCIF